MTFTGFPVDTLHFLRDLRENNAKAWFDANRDRYEEALLEPARDFVEAMGEAFVRRASRSTPCRRSAAR